MVVVPYWASCVLAAGCWEVVYLALFTPLGAWTLPKKALTEREGVMWRIKLVNVFHASIVGTLAWALLLFEPSSRALLDAALRFDWAYFVEHGYEGGDVEYTAKLVMISAGFFAHAAASLITLLSRGDIYFSCEKKVVFFPAVIARGVATRRRRRPHNHRWDLAHYADWEMKDPIMAMHHVISMTVWPTAMVHVKAPWFVLVNVSSEISSPLLQARWLSRTAHGKESAQFKLVSLAFALTFYVARTLIIPSIVYAYAATAPWAKPDCLNCLPALFAAITTVCIPVPQLLNAFWSAEIANLIRKTLKKKKVAKD